MLIVKRATKGAHIKVQLLCLLILASQHRDTTRFNVINCPLVISAAQRALTETLRQIYTASVAFSTGKCRKPLGWLRMKGEGSGAKGEKVRGEALGVRGEG